MHNPVSALAHVGGLHHIRIYALDRERVPTGCPPVLSRLPLSRPTKLDSSEPGSSRPASHHTQPYTIQLMTWQDSTQVVRAAWWPVLDE
jgi:hypothetical protein